MNMLIGLIILALAFIFPFLHYRYGNTVFRVLGLIGAGFCFISLIGTTMSYWTVGIPAPHIGFPIFLIAVNIQAFYLSIKTRKPKKPRSGEDILDL